MGVDLWRYGQYGSGTAAECRSRPRIRAYGVACRKGWPGECVAFAFPVLGLATSVQLNRELFPCLSWPRRCRRRLCVAHVGVQLDHWSSIRAMSGPNHQALCCCADRMVRACVNLILGWGSVERGLKIRCWLTHGSACILWCGHWSSQAGCCTTTTFCRRRKAPSRRRPGGRAPHFRARDA